jgi:type II secretion system protein C
MSRLETRRTTDRQGGQWRWIALAIGVGFGAFLVWQFWPYARGFFQRTPQEVVAKNKQAVPQVVAPPVAVQSDPALAAAGTDSSISKVPLALVLVGTLPGRNATEGTAMLGTDARNAQTYMAGAMLENGARLVEIYRDRVILERQKKRATLYLLGSPDAQKTAGKLNPLLAVGGQNLEPPKVTHYSVDPITDYIRTIPAYREDGTMAGFRAFAGERSGLFTTWGLKPGDVITSINGAALVDGDQANQLLGTLAEGSALTAKVTRGTESLTVSLDGAEIAKMNEARKAPQIALQPPP